MIEPNEDLKNFLEKLLNVVPLEETNTSSPETTWVITEETKPNLESEY